MALCMPDYNLEWILLTAASNTSYGGVLYQVRITDSGEGEYQPLKFVSKKWSGAATRWDTYSQECYGIFACVKDCEYLLRGKPFVIETHHNNLISKCQKSCVSTYIYVLSPIGFGMCRAK